MKTILFVDDEPLPSKLYVRALRESGFNVVQKDSVDEALEFARTTKDHVDAIILDVMMPPGHSFINEQTQDGVRTGFFLRKEMRKFYPNQPILLLTNINNPEILQATSGEEDVRIIHKFDYPPFHLAEEAKRIVG